MLYARSWKGCGQVKREPIWSQPLSKLDNVGRALDENINRWRRIIGGQNADLGHFPWQAALTSSSNIKIFCGGTLVSPTTVISAGICLINISKPEDLIVSVGHIIPDLR